MLERGTHVAPGRAKRLFHVAVRHREPRQLPPVPVFLLDAESMTMPAEPITIQSTIVHACVHKLFLPGHYLASAALDQLIAMACFRREARAVQHRDATPELADQPLGLQR